MDVFQLVKMDLDIRNEQGHERFGGPLTVHGPTNGGNEESTLVTAYMEALDLVVYLRKEIGRRGLMYTSNAKNS